MTRLFTAGNELVDPVAEGWYWDEGGTGSGSPSSVIAQRNGYQTTEKNGGNWYYYLLQDYDLKHFPGYFGRPPSFPVPDAYSELYVRFHFYAGNFVSGERAILSFVGGDNSTYFTVAIYDSGGSTVSGNNYGIYFREDTVGTAHITVGAFAANNVWTLIEARCRLGAGGTGLLELKANGVIIGSVAGTFTGPSAQTGMAGIHMRNQQNGGTPTGNRYDNFAINDTSGTVNNSWPGDGYVLLRTPHRDGTTTQLATDIGAGSADNADRIGVSDARTPALNFDGQSYWKVSEGYHQGSLRTTKHQGFVRPTAVPQKDTYTIKPLPFDAGAINAISLFSETVGRVSLSGNIRHLIKPPAQSEIQSAALPIPTDVLGPQASHYSINPNTSAAFTVTEVNSLEIGLQFEA